MSEWQHVRLSEVVDFGIGGTPSRNTKAFWAEKPLGHPWLSIADLKGKLVSSTAEHITDLGVRSSNVKLIATGTTVMSFKLTVGRTAITQVPMYCNEAIAFFEPKEQEVDSRWLYHELPRASQRIVTDTAVKGATLNKKKIAEIPLDIPPLREQTKIAQILDTLDTQIRQTEALIDKLERIKQGLLTDLLTCGIDQNGQLRPTPDQAPHLYKDSPLGRIPREWDVAVLSALCSLITDGKHGDCRDEEGSGYFFVSAKDISSGKINFAEARQITKSDFLETHRRTDLRPGDIVLSNAGTIGRLAVAPDQSATYRTTFQKSVAVLKPVGSLVDSQYLALSLEHYRARLEDLARGSSQKNLLLSDLSSFALPVAPVAEQRKIATGIFRIAELIEKNSTELESLSSEKIGLMDDLLTGRVRVTPLLDTADRMPA